MKKRLNAVSEVTIILWLFLWVSSICAKEATNLDKPIVQKSDPTKVTHRLKIGKLTFGFSDLGGGYLNYLDLGDGENVVSPYYGRGWQGSLRDRLHMGRYNPTQAGFHDHAGTPVSLKLTEGKLTIPKFNLPLYGDPVFDFTEHEDLVYDFKGYKDHGNSDTDGLDESDWTQDDELRSEFDFEGVYEDASKLGGGGIPILRFYCRYIYERDPKAILQFGKKAKKKDGRSVLDERMRVEDISELLPGAQKSKDVDLANIIFTGYGFRLFTKTGYTTPMWHEDGEWKEVTRKSVSGRGNEKQFELALSELQSRGKKKKKKSPTKVLESQFLLWAKGSDPKKSPAIALYCPMKSRFNAKPFVGLDKKTGKEVYRENRNTRSYIFFSHVIPDQLGVRSRFFQTGMLAPKHGNPNVVEALDHETFVLFGTPDQILNAVKTIEKQLDG